MTIGTSPPPLSDAPPQATFWTPLTGDVVIVGGGIVGLTLALALAHAALQVVVVEAQSFSGVGARPRAYALSLTSVDIFKGLGLWPQIAPQISGFQRVCLIDDDYAQAVDFWPSDLGTEAVYYGAEHGVLITALQQAVTATPNLHYLTSARLIHWERQPGESVAQVTSPQGNYQIRSPLIVAADGKQSALRQFADLSSFGWQYWQSCITTVVKPERPHQATAYERFWPSGPFAILPLPGQRCQIVWTAPQAEAEAIMALSEADFMTQLEQRFGSQMGRLQRLSGPALFPVQLMQCDRYIQPRLALVGDAAHSCHPVGGQGLNMGIRDAAALAEVLIAAHQRQEDLGGTAVLRRYEGWRRPENWIILTFTDLLTRTFSNQIWPLVRLRRLGLVLLNRVPPLKRLALKLMVGRLGRLPQLARIEQNQTARKNPVRSNWV
ncbi:MAG: FAD-dependent hydroxylase [Cyanobacteriota bacterium]|nr:FAD-dependent hydroxylase [Cyanobacteriota bacterium]